MAESYNRGRGLRHGQFRENSVSCGPPVSTEDELNALAADDIIEGQIRLVIGTERVYCYRDGQWIRITGSGIGGLRSIEVVDIDDPTELAAVLPRETDEVLLAFEPSATGAQPITMYRWVAGITGASPYTVDTAGGAWEAVDGRYSKHDKSITQAGSSSLLSVSGGQRSLHIASGNLRYDATASEYQFGREIVGFAPIYIGDEEYLFPLFGGADPGAYPLCDPGAGTASVTMSTAVPRTARVDDWQGAQAVTGGTANWKANASSLGGGRKVAVTSSNTTVNVNDPPVGSAVVSIASTLAGQLSTWTIAWDGDDTAALLSTVKDGIHDYDLTEDGSVEKFRLTYNFSAGSTGSLVIQIYSLESDWSTHTIPLSVGTNNVEVDFSSFSTGGGAGADFEHVTAVILTGNAINAGTFSLDIHEFGTVVTPVISIDTGGLQVISAAGSIVDDAGQPAIIYPKTDVRGVHFPITNDASYDIKLVDWIPGEDQTTFTYDVVSGVTESFDIVLAGRVPIKTTRGSIRNRTQLDVISSIAGPNGKCYLGTAADPAEAAVSTSAINFGSVNPNSPVTRTFTITNNGGSDLNIRDIKIAGPGAARYRINGRYAGATVAHGVSNTAEISIVLEYQHIYENQFDATVIVTTDAPEAEVLRVALSATVAPEIYTSPTSVDFTQDDLVEGDFVYRDLTVGNSGSGALDITSISITSGSPNFQTYGTPDTSNLPDGFERVVSLRYEETDPIGPRSGNLRIVNDDSDESNKDVPLIFREPILQMISPASEPAGPTGTVAFDATAVFNVTLQNIQTDITAKIDTISFVGGDAANFSYTGGPTEIGPLASGVFSFLFDPSGTTGEFLSTLRVTYNNTTGNSPLDIAVEANVPELAVASTMDFDYVYYWEDTNTLDLEIFNNGDVPMTVDSITIIGEQPNTLRGGAAMRTYEHNTEDFYSLDAGFFTGGVIAANDSEILRLALDPPGFRVNKIGKYNCQLSISTNGGNATVNVLCTMRVGPISSHGLQIHYDAPTDFGSPPQSLAATFPVGSSSDPTMSNPGDGTVTHNNLEIQAVSDPSRLDRWSLAIRDADGSLVHTVTTVPGGSYPMVGSASRDIFAVQATTPVRLTFYHQHMYLTGDVIYVYGTGTGLDGNTYTVTDIDGTTLSLNGTSSVGAVAEAGYVVAKYSYVTIDVDYDTTVEGDTNTNRENRFLPHEMYFTFLHDAWNVTVPGVQRRYILYNGYTISSKSAPPSYQTGGMVYNKRHSSVDLGAADFRRADSYPYRTDASGTTSSSIVTDVFHTWIISAGAPGSVITSWQVRDADIIGYPSSTSQYAHGIPAYSTSSTGINALHNALEILGFEKGRRMVLDSGTPGVNAIWELPDESFVGIKYRLNQLAMDNSTTTQLCSLTIPFYSNPFTVTTYSGLIDMANNAFPPTMTLYVETAGAGSGLTSDTYITVSKTNPNVADGFYTSGDATGFSTNTVVRYVNYYYTGVGYSNSATQPRIFDGRAARSNYSRAYVPQGKLTVDTAPVGAGNATVETTRIFIPANVPIIAAITIPQGAFAGNMHASPNFRGGEAWLAPSPEPLVQYWDAPLIPAASSYFDVSFGHMYGAAQSNVSDGTIYTPYPTISTITKPSKVRITTSSAHNFQTGWHVRFSGTGDSNLDGWNTTYGVSGTNFLGYNVFQIERISSTSFDLVGTESMPAPGAPSPGARAVLSGYGVVIGNHGTGDTYESFGGTFKPMSQALAYGVVFTCGATHYPLP